MSSTKIFRFILILSIIGVFAGVVFMLLEVPVNIVYGVLIAICAIDFILCIPLAIIMDDEEDQKKRR